MTLMTGLMFFAAAPAYQAEKAGAKPEVEVVLCRGIANRKPVEDEGPYYAGQKVCLWTSVSGVGQGFIEHVWYRDGQEVARHYLPVGSSGRRWRTWSRHQLGRGEYTVVVVGPDGRELGSLAFTALGLEELPGC